MTSEAFWALARGSGLVLLVLMTVNLLLGILTRSGKPLIVPRFGAVLLHRNVALLSVVFLVVHVVTLVLDPYAGIPVVSALVPFTATYRPLWVGFGTLCLDLLAAIVITALLRHRIGQRAFKAVHWAAYLLWPMAVLHAIGSGSDTPAVLVVGAVCAVAVAAAVLWRATADWFGRRVVRPGTDRRLAPVGASVR